MVGGFYATNIGATQPFGVEGWRFAFHLVRRRSTATTEPPPFHFAAARMAHRCWNVSAGDRRGKQQQALPQLRCIGACSWSLLLLLLLDCLLGIVRSP
jgi:hypothetical protein